MTGYEARKDGVLVVGGVAHDMDFVRLELLRMLGRWPWLRTVCVADFEHCATLSPSDFLISYTCNVRPSAAAEAALESFVKAGGRWLALHATNSWLTWTAEGVGSEHRASPFFTTLGSAFLAHPPLGRFLVEVQSSDDPLLAGIGDFEVEDDELYLSTFLRAPDEVLLATRFSGETPGFLANRWSDDAWRPIMYRNRLGAGEVLYLSLGHARGHWDAPHRTPYYPKVERGAWTSPSYLEILRRSLLWVAEENIEGTKP
ncbi:MAG: ThuA domain-containing protein [Gammaproteobacteria bacterium]|nr:ThuA domain-containing protein [Gammaproteobacteria bacterium]